MSSEAGPLLEAPPSVDQSVAARCVIRLRVPSGAALVTTHTRHASLARPRSPIYGRDHAAVDLLPPCDTRVGRAHAASGADHSRARGWWHYARSRGRERAPRPDPRTFPRSSTCAAAGASPLRSRRRLPRRARRIAARRASAGAPRSRRVPAACDRAAPWRRRVIGGVVGCPGRARLRRDPLLVAKHRAARLRFVVWS